ncbi:MAG: N-acetylglucosamine-6-sulfatase [Myxococcota bacterium]
MAGPSRRDVLWTAGLTALAGCAPGELPPASTPPPTPEPAPPPPPAPAVAPHGGSRRNVILIMVDDQRADGFGLGGHPFLQTPNLDRLGTEGAWFREAFVTTSLCCPSRASMLSGLYAHSHGVVNNKAELADAIPTWNKLLQQAGVKTAYVGKWHMGGPSSAPRPGWDHWVSFPGQGRYNYPGDKGSPEERQFNINGELVPVEGYVTDLVTDHAVDWLKSQAKGERFAMVIGHKACHAPFEPAPRHADAFADAPVPAPLPDTDAAYKGRPNWLRRMRESLFGAETLYNGRWKEFADWYRDYHRTLLSVDESVGRLLATLEETGLAGETLILYTSDNGFMTGERGVLDKRCFYEESIRVPLLAWAPGLVSPGARPEGMALNIDLAPTILDVAGFGALESMHGASLMPLLGDGDPEWRDVFLYEYFFERAFPQCPTVLGVRTREAKLISYHGVWEVPEFYDLQADPGETSNLLRDPAFAKRRSALWKRLRGQLKRYGGLWSPAWGAGMVDAAFEDAE